MSQELNPAESRQPAVKPWEGRQSRTRAWKSPAFEQARLELDVWAAIEMERGTIGVPTVDRIRGVERVATLRDAKGKIITNPRTGRDEELDATPARTKARLSKSELIHLEVETVVAELGPVYRAVLLALYPRSGPYCRHDYDALPTDERDREKEILSRLEINGHAIVGTRMREVVVKMLCQCHADAVWRLSGIEKRAS